MLHLRPHGADGLAAQRLRVRVAGAIKKWGPTADATFAAERPIWDRMLRLGADLASVAMDGR